jgi:hypothetical protein
MDIGFESVRKIRTYEKFAPVFCPFRLACGLHLIRIGPYQPKLGFNNNNIIIISIITEKGLLCAPAMIPMTKFPS